MFIFIESILQNLYLINPLWLTWYRFVDSSSIFRLTAVTKLPIYIYIYIASALIILHLIRYHRFIVEVAKSFRYVFAARFSSPFVGELGFRIEKKNHVFLLLYRQLIYIIFYRTTLLLVKFYLENVSDFRLLSHPLVCKLKNNNPIWYSYS